MQITVLEEVIPQWRYGNSGELRLFLTDTIVTSDGDVLVKSTKESFYKKLTLSIGGGNATIPETVLDSITDSSNSHAKIVAYFYVRGERKDFFCEVTIPHVMGSSVTWPQLINFTTRALPFTNEETYSKVQTQLAIAAATDGLQDQIDSFDDDIASVQDGIASVQGDITTINGEITAIQGGITTIEGDITTIEGDITTIEGDVSTIESEITTINNTLSSINTANLSADYGNSLATAISSIGATVVDLIINADTTVSSSQSVPENIRIKIENQPLISVDSGQTLTIHKMAPIGSQKIFTGSGTVRLIKTAVPEFNLAWWGGIDESADLTSAISSALANINTNGGGVLAVPTGLWKTSGGHLVPSFITIKGTGGDVDAAVNTKFVLTSGAAGYMFKVLEGFRSVSFRDLTLDGAGITTASLFWANNATGVNSGALCEFTNVHFHGTGSGSPPQVLMDSGVGGLISHVHFANCFWITPNNSTAVKLSDSNLDAIFTQPSMLLGVNSKGFDIAGTTQVNIVGPNFGGSVGSLSHIDTVQRSVTGSITNGTKNLTFTSGVVIPDDIGHKVVISGKLNSYITAITSSTTATVNDNATATATAEALDVYRATPNTGMALACIYYSGAHGNVNIIGSADEGVQWFIYADAPFATGLGVTNIRGSLIQSPVTCVSQYEVIYSSGNRYFANTFMSGAGGLVILESSGDWVLPTTVMSTRTIVSPKLLGAQQGVTLVEETTNCNQFYNYSHVARTPQEYKYTYQMNQGADSHPTLPVVAIASAFDSKALLRIGVIDIYSELFTDYYEAKLDTNRLQWTGSNASSGFDFISNAVDIAVFESTGVISSLVLSSPSPSNPNCQLRFRHDGTDYWAISSYSSVHGFSIFNIGLGNDAVLINPSTNATVLYGNTSVDPGKKLTVGSDGTNAGLNILPVAGDPSGVVDGDIWYNSSTHKFRGRQNGASVDLA